MAKRFVMPGRPGGYLTPGRPRYLREQPFDPREHTAGPRAPRTIQLMALIWATWNLNDPTDFASLQASSSRKGYNWQVWEQALVARIEARGGNVSTELVQDAQRFWVNGEAVLDLASMFDLVFLGHWFPLEMVQAIKARSTAPRGTRVHLWGDFESVAQDQPYSPGAQAYWGAIASVYPLLTPAANSYGDFGIDKYELTGTGNVGCPHTPNHAGLPFPAPNPSTHTWDMDVYAAMGEGDERAAEEQVSQMFFEHFDMAYVDDPAGHYVIDGVALDNLLENPFKGTATNGYPAGWTANYRTGWLTFLAAWDTMATDTPRVDANWESLWCNGPLGIGVYPLASLRSRYVEHFFRTGLQQKEWPEIAADLDAVKTNGTWVVLAGNGNEGNVWYWFTTGGGQNPAVNGTWASLLKKLHDSEIEDQVWIAACQTLAEGYTFWQAGFRTPS